MSEREVTTSRSFPWAAATAGLLLLCGSGLIVGGVHELAGPGWALLAGAVPCLILGTVILRGLT